MSENAELNLENPEQPRRIKCDANTYFDTLKHVRAKGGRIEQIVTKYPGEYELVICWRELRESL